MNETQALSVYFKLDQMIDIFEALAEEVEYQEEICDNSAFLENKDICKMYNTLCEMRNVAYSTWKAKQKEG